MGNSELISLLKTEVVDIEFVKRDGSTRLMTCTLSEDHLPDQTDIAEQTSTGETLNVFDTINQGWRSFRWDSLKKVNGEAFV